MADEIKRVDIGFAGGQVPLHDIPRVEERQRVLNDLLHRLHDGIPGNEGT